MHLGTGDFDAVDVGAPSSCCGTFLGRFPPRAVARGRAEWLPPAREQYGAFEDSTDFLRRREFQEVAYRTRRPIKSNQRDFYRPSTLNVILKMPAIRSARNRKPPPDGFDDIEDTLLEFANKMKDAENASHEGKKKQEMVWPIFQISHQRMYHLSVMRL